jgi:light-regulated signal transduction histidine kinase (bacteriophytochrome)
LLAIGIDVTERLIKEKEVQKLNSELSRSNKDLEDFTYAVSHDLKEPLRKIFTFGKFLIEDYAEKLDEQGIALVQRMQDASERMKKMISDLLDLSRVGTSGIQIVPIDPNKIVDDVLDLFQFTKTKEDPHKIQKYSDAYGNEVIVHPLPAVMADKTLLPHLFQNFISNGLKFHKDNEVAIIEIHAIINGGWIVFSVKDNGIGIEKQFYERIFGVFQRLNSREKYTGSGVGLALCKKIIERHGGEIWCESEINKGSTFYFTLKKT